MSDTPFRPPRDNLYRAVAPGAEWRAADDAAGPPMMFGHFARFNEPVEIDSWIEGRFIESIKPGAFARTLKNKGSNMPILFQHGRDPELGDKVIATPEELREDEIGPYFEARPLDGVPPLVLNGLREGRYGISYRFRVLKEDFDPKPKKSRSNPEGLPERTIEEAEVFEFGPVTFPADVGADIGMRSITDAYTAPDVIRQLLSDPERVRDLMELRPDLVRNDPALASAIEDALPDDGPGESHSDEGTRAEEPEAPTVDPPPDEAVEQPEDPAPEAGSLSVREDAPTMNTIEERESRLTDIETRMQEIQTEHGVDVLPEAVQAEWDQLLEEREDHTKAINAYESRMAALERSAARKSIEREPEQGSERGRPPRPFINRSVEYNIAEIRAESRTDVEFASKLRDNALRAVEQAAFPHERANDAKNKAHLERLLKADEGGQFAARLLATGNPVYARAFGKLLSGMGHAQLTSEEQRAIGTVGSGQNADGGFAVPYTLDPTIILTSDGQVNPLRSMARIETLTVGNTWKGVTSAGITVSRVAEETAVTDTSPVLAQPTVTVQAVKAEIRYSIESDGDWPRLQAEMARLLQDAKDNEEATQFITGNGNGTTGNPEGVVAGLAATSHVGTTGDGLTVDDLFRLQGALPDRFEPTAQFLAHRAVYNQIRQFGTGSSVGEGAVWQNSLQPGQPGQLIGYPARTASGMSSDFTTTDELVLLFGDFSNGYIIVDKVGMSIEIDPHVRDGSGDWTGQRALLAHWRNNGMVLVDNALRLLKIGVIVS